MGNSDPIEDWRAVEQPSLMVYGELNTNVPTEESIDRLEQLGNPNITIEVYEGQVTPSKIREAKATGSSARTPSTT